MKLFTKTFFSVITLLVMVVSVRAQTITTIAGGGTGEGRIGTEMSIQYPSDVLFKNGNLFFTQRNRIMKMNLITGIVSTIAGRFNFFIGPDTGDSVSVVNAVFGPELALTSDAVGNIYVADAFYNRIRKINIPAGIVTTIAGSDSAAYFGDGGFAKNALLNHPTGIAIDSSGNLIVADTYNSRIRKIDLKTGIITTIIGTAVNTNSGDGGLAINASVYSPSRLFFDNKWNLYIPNYNTLRKVDAATGIINTIAGSGIGVGYAGDGGLATNAKLYYIEAVCVDAFGNVYISDGSNYTVRKINATTGIITTIAGNGVKAISNDGGFASASSLYSPRGICLDSSNNLYIVDNEDQRIRRVNLSNGIISTAIGNGYYSFSGDGDFATKAQMFPLSSCVDNNGDIYVADNNRIRKINSNTGVITTIAGSNSKAYSGDGGLATNATFNLNGLAGSSVLALDKFGNIYLNDNSVRIRKINASNNLISTVVGNGQTGTSGDGGVATAARLFRPEAFAIDSVGNIYIADSNRIRKVTAATGIINTIAGTGVKGFSGDGGLAINAKIYPRYIKIDQAGNILFTDSFRIRKITVATGIITTIAGNGTRLTYPGDSSLATAIGMYYPYGLELDANNNIYIFPGSNNTNKIIAINSITGRTKTIVGNGLQGYSGDGGLATNASINYPNNLSIDKQGNFVFSEPNNYVVRKVIIPQLPVPIITSFTPSNSCTSSLITIKGSNFTNATAVTIGGTSVTSFTVNSDTIINAVIGNGTTGLVQVTSPNGTGTSVNTFSFGNTSTTYAYVTNTGSNNVSVINTASDIVTANIVVGSTPIGVCFSPDALKAYITNNGSNSVSVINTATNMVSATITVGANPVGITISPDGSKIYVVNQGSNNVSVINTATNTITATVTVGTRPNGITISPNGSKVYVVNSSSSNISVINTATNTIAATITIAVDGSPNGISISPDGSKLYVTMSSIINSNMTIVNTITNTVTTTVATGINPVGIGLSPDGTRAYLAMIASNMVNVINTTNNTVIATVAVGTQPVGVSVSPDGTKVYITNNGTNNVSVINAVTNTVTATIAVGSNPQTFGNFLANIPTACTTLPLNLLTFTAQKQNNTVNLAWQTTNEVNTSHFTIQSSVDGTSFNNIGKVVAKGDGGYTYIDNQLPNTSFIYYRLQMIDKDGSFMYSKVVAVTLVDNRKMFVLFPNPAKDNLFVQFTCTKAEKLTLQVTDLQGRILQQETTQVGIGNVSLSVNTAALAKGSYVLLVKSSNGLQQKQFVKE